MNICWFTTGEDQEALALLKDIHGAFEQGVVAGRISLIFMDREQGESPASDGIMAFAAESGIPLEPVSRKRFLEEKGLTPEEGRDPFDVLVKSRIEKYGFDLIFLGGYTQGVSPELYESCAILGIHPSPPRAYVGKRTDVIAGMVGAGERTFGATVYLAAGGPDKGLPVAFAKSMLQGTEIDLMYDNAFRGDRSSREMLMKIAGWEELAIEAPLIAKTLVLISKGDIRIADKQVFYQGVPVPGGVDISEVITRLNPEAGRSEG